MIAGYDGQPMPMANPQLLLTNRLKLEGFIVSEHMEVWPEALKELGALVASGKLQAARVGRAGHRVGARGLPRPAQGQELRQAAGQADLNAGARGSRPWTRRTRSSTSPRRWSDYNLFEGNRRAARRAEVQRAAARTRAARHAGRQRWAARRCRRMRGWRTSTRRSCTRTTGSAGASTRSSSIRATTR